MSKTSAIRRALRGALGKNGANAAVGAVANGGISAAMGGDANQIATNAVNGGIIGANFRALRKIGIEVRRAGAAKKAAKRTGNANPVSAVKVRANEIDRKGVNAVSEKPLARLTEKEEALLRILDRNPGISNEKAVRLLYSGSETPSPKIIDEFKTKLRRKGWSPE